jgi:hypothetical protein
MVTSHVPVMSAAAAEAGNGVDRRPQNAIVNAKTDDSTFI